MANRVDSRRVRVMTPGLLVLILATVGIGLLHVFTPGHLTFWHAVYRRISYFPITIGALWFGMSGGVGLALLNCVAFIPHLMHYRGHGLPFYYGELIEMIFYLSAGGVVGLLANRESRLRKKYQKLSRALESSYRKLRTQARQLLEVENQVARNHHLSVLGHLSAGLAHEIKNPLAAIRGTTEILREDFPESHEKYEFFQIMQQEISRLNQSVEEILGFCRGQQAPAPVRETPLHEVIHQVSALLDKPIREKRIRLKTRITDECLSPPFMVDGPRVSQVLMNILLNAVQAVHKGGQVEMSCSKEKEKGCRITITDNGPGISPDQEKTLFTPFVSHKEGGNGLGLSISLRIVESWGGRLTLCASALGGAGFELLIPDSTTKTGPPPISLSPASELSSPFNKKGGTP